MTNSSNSEAPRPPKQGFGFELGESDGFLFAPPSANLSCFVKGSWKTGWIFFD